jgi:aspartate/tyrosine/aromatic aminotransferase
VLTKLSHRLLLCSQDPILGITEAYLANKSPDKMNLGVVRQVHARSHSEHIVATPDSLMQTVLRTTATSSVYKPATQSA